MQNLALFLSHFVLLDMDTIGCYEAQKQWTTSEYFGLPWSTLDDNEVGTFSVAFWFQCNDTVETIHTTWIYTDIEYENLINKFTLFMWLFPCIVWVDMFHKKCQFQMKNIWIAVDLQVEIRNNGGIFGGSVWHTGDTWPIGVNPIFCTV